MKKRFLITLAFIFSCLFIWAQGLPSGINYQAVARDSKGQPMVNKDINFKISLLAGDAQGKTVYEETHSIHTGEIGMFGLIVGQGKALRGEFSKVPWSEQQIWMEVSIDENNTGKFVSLSASKLMAVPYAFHAGTADAVVGEESTGRADLGPSAFWKVNGNNMTIPGSMFMGTIDYKDLVFKTNSLERMRITKDGDINISNSLSVGVDINVGRDANIGRNLNVTGIARFNNTAQSNTKDDGSVIVEGGVGIEKNVNIGGNTEIDGTLGVDGVTTLKNTTESTTKDNGSLVVEGGVGIEKNINVGGNSGVTGNSSIGGTLGVNGIATFNNTTQSTTKDNGAVVIEGGVGIEKNINIGGNITVAGTSALNGQVTVHANFGGNQDDYGVYPLRVEGGAHGLAIKINGVKPERNANFLTMFDGTGAPMGRIEGFQVLSAINRDIVKNIVNGVDTTANTVNNASQDQDQAPSEAPPSATQFFNSNYGFGLIVSMLDFVNSIVKFAINAIAAAFICIGGDCDDVVWAGIEVIVNGVKLAGYIIYNELNPGVAFESGGADYAEWLKKADKGEAFGFGDVVGVKAGIISKEFIDADKFMVISQSPTVIGAMPGNKKNEALYEKIAFMGQVQVKVIGVANKGDYILPSGNGDGMAIAVSPANMKTLDYKRIIGIAWGESDGKKLFEYVNTAVGINSNDLAQSVENLEVVMNKMQIALKQVNPSYEPSFFDVNGNSIAQRSSSFSKAETLNQIAANQIFPSSFSNLNEAMQPVVQFAEAQKMDLGQYPYLLDLINNPTDKVLAQKTLDHYTKVLSQLEGYMEISGRR